MPQTLKPNLLLMVDNSFSMYDPAYYSTTSFNTNPTTGIYPGYDNSYNDATTYVGYYTPTQLYEAMQGTTFADDGNCSYFTPYSGSFSSGTCTYINTSYLCLTLNAGWTDVTTFRASGNFLNWLTASKMDVQKLVLTGGKYDSSYQKLIGETRGWNSMRYLKEVNTGTNAVTFGVRGPSNGKYPDFGSSDGGTTRVDVFLGNFGNSDCQQAIWEWLYGNLGQAKLYTSRCIPDPPATGSNATLPAFNHVMQSCWFCGTPCTAAAMGNGDITRMENDCDRYYGTLSSAPPTYAQANTLAGVCAISPNAGLPYVGDCFKSGGSCNIGSGQSQSHTCDSCVATGIANYCNGVTAFPVVDPTGDALLTQGVNGAGTLPAFLLNVGTLAQLGFPIKTYQARLDKSSAPTGLIHDFYNLIKFGVMVFNTDGSVSECASTQNMTCPSGSNADGGKIISYIPTTDDQATLDAAKQPLIDSINAITASTWTPYSEAFYNALGYFANRSDLRLNTADFDLLHNPVNYTCRQNNILIVTDGVSTADLHPSVTSLVNPANSPDGDNDSDNSCLFYGGSKYLDDLSYIAKHKKITDFTQTPTKASEYITTYTVFNGEDNGRTDECSPVVLLQNTATNGGGVYQSASNASQLQNALRSAFLSISAKAASGTAASVLGEKSREGSNILQAVFYPNKLFNITTPSSTLTLSWLGYLNNFWFYEDATINVSNIREDTVNDSVLNLVTDKIVSFDFVNDQLIVHSWQDTNGDGVADTALVDKTLDDVKLIWESGKILFKRTPSSRKIYVNDSSTTYPKTTGGSTCSGGNLVTFETSNKTCFSSYLGGDLNGDGSVNAADTTQADRLISYITGTDYSEYRSRTLPLTNPVDSTVTGTWKLGDIIHSTPLIVKYSNVYSDYSVAFVGGNDGMLHAFKIGKLNTSGLSGSSKAQLTTGSADSIVLGEELWSFIPKNTLPYLRFYADPNYCHSYMVDMSPYLYSYGSKRILIGGMRLGGGCGGTSSVNPPTDTCSNPSTSSCVGMSSYFALDIKDPKNPKLLWEFTDPSLKFTFSGPAVINRDNVKYVLFLSGPNGYDGSTNQNLKMYVLKLNSDDTINTSYTIDMGAGFTNSFGGRLFTKGIDLNEDGNTDFVFFGYSRYFGLNADGYPRWGGGVVKLHINGSDPTLWAFDKNYVTFANSEGYPVTARVATDKCFDNYYLYFSSGRYFSATELYNTNSGPSTAKPDIIGGVPFLCDYLNNCSVSSINIPNVTAGSQSSPNTVCTNLSTGVFSNSAWYVGLDPIVSPYYMERGITDPVTTGANYVMFVTAKPTDDVCSFSGNSRIWGFNCATGGTVPSNVCSGKIVNTSSVRGTLLLQLSTAAINQVNIINTFGAGAQYTPNFAGMPSGDPPPKIDPTEKNKMIHWLTK
ncbi:MAG: hypothetical protein HQL06_01655 [Nitrospirae bacterium]|nr:hypothetical protein [Nitrospirota bacterium]